MTAPSKFTRPDAARDHVQGNVNAPITLLEYGDYECPACGQAQPMVNAIRQGLGKQLCFAFRHFPLTNLHPHADHAAQAAEAAGVQGRFWEMHDLLFENQDALDDESLAAYAAALALDDRQLIREVIADAYSDRVREDFKSGIWGGVNGTPTFFINGERYDGALGLEPLLAALRPRGR